MRFDDEGKAALQRLQARATCKLAEIRRLLAPDLEPPYDATTLLARAEEHAAELLPAERAVFQMRIVVAYAELERLVQEMSFHVDEVGSELKVVRTRTKAINAYRRVPQSQELIGYQPF